MILLKERCRQPRALSMRIMICWSCAAIVLLNQLRYTLNSASVIQALLGLQQTRLMASFPPKE